MTRAEALTNAAQQLEAAGVETPILDAKRLLMGIESIDASALISAPDERLQAKAAFDSAVARRCQREPVSKILGVRSFWTHEFIVTADVLDPRPDTELIVETALSETQGTPPDNILDLGTGSGCILLSLLSELPSARGVGVDTSQAALDVAHRNASVLNLADRTEFICSNWFSGLDGTFNLVVSNPPYISSSESETLAPEVTDWDPAGALFAGMDGLQAYQDIAVGLSAVLEPNGMALFEVGTGQAASVREIFEAAGFRRISSRFDIGGIERCLVVQK